MARPRFLAAGALALAAALALSACAPASSGGGGATEPTASAGAGFSHTMEGYDNREFTLEKRPERIVTDVYSAAALWDYGIRPVGIFGYGFDSPDGLGNVDVDSIETIIGKDADYNLEKLAAAKPDLVIGVGNSAGDGWTWWDDAVTAQSGKIAPYLAVQMASDPVQAIEEYRALAVELGGDSSAVDDDKKDFEAALERITALAADRSDVRVLAMAPMNDVVYTVANLGNTNLLRDAGVQLVGPPAEGDSPFAELSWETVGEHPADIILVLDTAQELVSGIDAFTRLPAAAAGQTMDYNDKRAWTYGSYAEWLNRFADLYEKARVVA